MEPSKCSKCGMSWAGTGRCPACGAPPVADREFDEGSRTCPECGKYVRFVPSLVVWYCDNCRDYVG